MQPELQAVVRSTLPEAATAVPAIMRARPPSAVRGEVRARSHASAAPLTARLFLSAADPHCTDADCIAGWMHERAGRGG